MSNRDPQALTAGAVEPEQQALFGGGADPLALDARRDENGKLPTTIFRDIRAGAAGPRGRGRPAGSRNKRSGDLAKLIVHQHGDPVLAMASIYSTPLDQLVEMLLIADGSQERQGELQHLIEQLTEAVTLAVGAVRSNLSDDTVRELAKTIGKLEQACNTLQGKPGDLAMKALNAQLAAAREVAAYVHSKKPTEQHVKVSSDGVLVMPARGAGGDFDALHADTKDSGQIINDALRAGVIQPADLGTMQLVDGRLIVDGEYVEVPDADDGEGET